MSMKVLSLSKYVLQPICCEWLEAKSIGKLDSAICSCTERPLFLELLQVKVIEGFQDKSATAGYLKWISCRHIFIGKLTLGKDLIQFFPIDCYSAMNRLHRLQIEDSYLMYSNQLESLLKYCNNLEEIYINKFTLLANRVIIALGSHCPRLQTFECENIHVRPRPKFQYGQYGDYTHGHASAKKVMISDEAVIHLVHGCRQLKRINFSQFVKLSDTALTAISTYCVMLEHLDLSNIDDISVAVIGQNCPKLKSLYLCNCTTYNSESIKAIALGCPLLEILNLQSAINPYYGMWVAPTQTQNVNTFHGEMYTVWVECMMLVAQNCPKLKVLDCSGMSFMDDKVMTEIAAHCLELEELHINGCNLVTDVGGLECILESCPVLRVLSIRNTHFRGSWNYNSNSVAGYQLKWRNKKGANFVFLL